MAKKRVGKFPKAFRQMAVDRLNHCENIVTRAEELGVSRRLLYPCVSSSSRWRAAKDHPRLRGRPRFGKS